MAGGILAWAKPARVLPHGHKHPLLSSGILEIIIGSRTSRLMLWTLILGNVVFVPRFSAAQPERSTPLATASNICALIQNLPALTSDQALHVQSDWLTQSTTRKATVYRGTATNEILLDNGLIRRAFCLTPNAATIGLDNRSTGASLLRGIKPEAIIELDGQTYAIGGLLGQPDYAYLDPAWLGQMTNDPAAFQFAGFKVGPIEPRFPWKRARRSAPSLWPPAGVMLTLVFHGPSPLGDQLVVNVHYELYDGLPVLSKWLEVENHAGRFIMLNRFTSEILAAVEGDSAVDSRRPGEWRLPLIHVQTDYSFAGMDHRTATRTVEWIPDPHYTSQVNYLLKTPCLLMIRSPLGPEQTIPPGARFQSFRTFELVHDSEDRERQGLAVRRMMRTLCPWATENPIMMHVRNSDSASFRRAVDQCAEVGFEMIIYTFGSGLDMESEDPIYLDRIRADVDYAHQKGIEVGAYSLLASRRVSDQHDVINPDTGKTGGAVFGNSPCLCSRWGDEYFRKIRRFIEITDLDLLEHDGSYPGDVCASTRHPGHRGLADSQWTQWHRITEFYQWCRERGTYLNVPDYYFLNGSSKTAMGYREVNWSLPRDRQIILGRQNIFDGTWEKTPSMGWMFVPLVEYHGGGAAATLEPLHQHLDAYEAHLANNFGAGVQACYRGPRLYDTEATKAMVIKWVTWFKRYRDILESDIIHVRRADGRDLDCLLHVNPQLPRKGLAMIYNPTDQSVKKSLRLPLYYTGLTKAARIRLQEGPAKRYSLNRAYEVTVPVSVPANGVTWLVIE
jgi:hypothetical protein